MKLLILTQKVSITDPILGFFHSWIKEFASHYEKVTVVCLEKGPYDLPDNVEVLSLGKEERRSRVRSLLRLYGLIVRRRREYDHVFVHMNPEYIVAGGILWRALGKKISLWYIHRQVTWRLRVATYLSNIIFSATAESFRIPSKKVHFVGHGIETEVYNCASKKDHHPTILHVGRITPIKRCDVLVRAFAKAKKAFEHDYRLTFVGDAVTPADHFYKKKLLLLVEELSLGNSIEFVGSVPHREAVGFYCNASVSVNLTPTGGMDKAVLESLASGTLCLTSNQAFAYLYGGEATQLLFKDGDADDLAHKLVDVLDSKWRMHKEEIERQLRKKVQQQFDYKNLIASIVNLLQ